MASRLKQTIHNQLDIATAPLKSAELLKGLEGRETSLTLTLRKFDLLLILPEVLLRCKPHAPYITKLDVSFSSVNFHTLRMLCSDLVNLRVLHAVSCGLSDTSDVVLWPRKLQDLDFSRNALSKCPQGITELLYLTRLNLSGNRIDFIPPDLLKIPCLKKCFLLNNPIQNIPNDIYLEGVGRMRSFLEVEPLPLPQELVPAADASKGIVTSRTTRASSASPQEMVLADASKGVVTSMRRGLQC